MRQETINVESLLDLPVWQMTGRQFCALAQYVNASNGAGNSSTRSRTFANGVQALADELGCSPSTVYALMRAVRAEDNSAAGGGILKEAIVSRIGRRIVFDVELARELAESFSKRRRECHE